MFIAFFFYTAALAVALPVRKPVPQLTLGVNALVIFGFLLLAWADGLRRALPLGALRDWYPYTLLLLAYREMGWFAPGRHGYALEQGWVKWDKLLLNDLGVKAAIEWLGPGLPSLLEISYTLVYTIAPFCVVVLYVANKRERIDRFTTVMALGVLPVYALFPLFPSEPPWTVFPGQDMPAFDTVFRRFNAAMLGSQGIHTSVFPSAHVSGSFTAAIAMTWLLPERPWVGRGLLALAALIATATVYGRYHYAADAAAGLAAALLVGLGCRRRFGL